MNKPKFIIMCGYPASGKNYWIKNHNKGYIVVELDWIRREIFGHQFHTNAEPFIIGFAKSIVRLLLSQNKNVIVNSTGLTRWIRQEWYNIGKEYNADITVVWIATSEQICNKRNSKRTKNRLSQDVIDRLIAFFQPPDDELLNVANIKLKIIKTKYENCIYK